MTVLQARIEAGKTMAEFDAKSCEAAAEMLEKLGTEVTRLRLCIQHWDHCRMDRFELRKAVDNWSYDA